MKIYRNNYILKCFVLLGVITSSFACQKETWDDHYELNSQFNDITLLELIQQEDNLSKFAGLLELSGYDSTLVQNQAFTVWAPSNDAFASISDDILTDPVEAKALVANHIALFSHTSTNIPENGLVAMFNKKSISFVNTDGAQTFSTAIITDADNLCNNGVLHIIDNVVEVLPNIWEALYETTQYPMMLDYFSATSFLMFDVANSTETGKNTLGETVYDSVFVQSNSYFDIVGSLNLETERHTFLPVSNEAYDMAYENLSPYFSHPDSISVVSNTESLIYNNLVFAPFVASELTGYYVTNTLANSTMLNASDVVSETVLSNGTMLELSSFPFSADEIIYKPIRFELETTDRRTISSATDLTIAKTYDVSASNQFTNIVSLNAASDSSRNDYFEIEFTNVLAADYNLVAKFTPSGQIMKSKLRFELNVFQKDELGELEEIEVIRDTMDINPFLDDTLHIGEVFSNDVFVDASAKNPYHVKLKATVDVSDYELILYTRKIGIDYFELIPAE